MKQGRIEIKDIVKNVDHLYAHTRVDDERYANIHHETLAEHTSLTEKYFQLLSQKKDLSAILLRFGSKMYAESVSDAAKSLFTQMFDQVVTFHDAGKANPLFQKDKMKNHQTLPSGLFKQVGSRHSMLSAVCYINFFYEQINRMTLEEKRFLRKILLINAYLIARHHSDLGSFEAFCNSFEQDTGSVEGMRTVMLLDQEWGRIFHGKPVLSLDKVRQLKNNVWEQMQSEDYACSIAYYAYGRLLYSLLVASDYYATSEYMSGQEIKDFGDLQDIYPLQEVYEKSAVLQSIRHYEQDIYPTPPEHWWMRTEINHLRSELFLEAEKEFLQNSSKQIFYLEAPTGSGKSNTSMNLGFQMMRQDSRLQKIFYVYPFNTLVEQNLHSLQKVFDNHPEILERISVINSTTPIKGDERLDEYDAFYYQKALLDRQFFNYPMLLITHVGIFETMFGESKEAAFGFHQLINSVIILDEIQSYKNSLWSEIIHFLRCFAELLNIKIIIMSATLPRLSRLAGTDKGMVYLIKERERYFSHPCFRDRVQVSYDLLETPWDHDILYQHVKKNSRAGKKILIEFIRKDSAKAFYFQLKADLEINCRVELMTGEDSIFERSRILNLIHDERQIPLILVATQTIEAGVDIDMDIGYKNISLLDSEEQFMGRINRSAAPDKSGIVYFFQVDDCRLIYRDDNRRHKVFTLETEEIREYLRGKRFDLYYEKIMEIIRKNRNEQMNDEGLEAFFGNCVSHLDFESVKRRMQLIEDDHWSMRIYLAHVLADDQGNTIDGRKTWEEYVQILSDYDMDYAEKRFKLSVVTSQMNLFLYQVKKVEGFSYNDKIGDIYYIEEGEKYFENGKLDSRKLVGEIADFVDFI